MDNYVLRLKSEAVRRFLDALPVKFESPIRYRGKFYGWDTVIRLKAQELARYILGKQTGVSFDDAKPALDRQDTTAVRDKILSLSIAEGRKLGIGKSTLWYLQRRARTAKPMKTYSKIGMKLT